MRDHTVRLGASALSPIDAGALWEYGTDRSRGRHAHGFTFLADWIGAAPSLDTEEATELSTLFHRLLSEWDERFDLHRESAPEMAFHDETTAQRLLGVVGVLDRFALTEEQQDYFRDFAQRTAAILVEPDFYGGVNNHGMFQDLALIAWSSIVSPTGNELGDDAWDLAARRLHTYFSACFTAEGVHVENTPTYHVMVARYLPILADVFAEAGSPEAELYRKLLPGAADYAVHCITPEALYPPVSDTHRRRLDSSANLETFTDGEFEYAATGGARGTQPTVRTRVFPNSGYALTRSAWGDPDATFVHFACAYNADYHKHSDEQSIYLRSGGRDLLCEAGPYGYNWRDPFTTYAYSSAAHNSLVVGGKGLPRTEPENKRSADSLPLNELDVRLARDDLLDATGTTRRYKGRVWKRSLRVAHGRSASDSLLTITDTVGSTVGPENLTFIWHIGCGLRIALRSNGAEVFDRAEKVMEIEFHATAPMTLRVVEGAEEPSIQGWKFPDFGQRVASPVILVDIRAEDLTLTTEVRLSDFAWDSVDAVTGDDHSDSFEDLTVNGQTVTTWSSPGSSDRSVLILSEYSSEAERERLVAALAKSNHTVEYFADIAALIGGTAEVAHKDSTAASDFVPAREAAIDQIAQVVVEYIHSQASSGIQVTVATVGLGFGPGVIAALESGTPLISLNPVLPTSETDPVAARFDDRFTQLIAEHPTADIEILSSGDSAGELKRSLRVLGSRTRTYPRLQKLLRADLEDGFSGVLVNALDVRGGDALKFLALYDRLAREFVLEIPDAAGAEVSVRVFRGREQVHAMPYAPGPSHHVAYVGEVGPHRLRVHIRGPQFSEPIVFTTTPLRVR
ncbi:hypothetical protein JCM18882A_32790 [Brevibacterium metallidurans]|uniref:Heparinase II/III-like C-terminal domain-containing protein n=2 Tax=Brevibacterium metallidurans TaxID=1482676 RepID=A0ABN0SSR8_9MICO